FKFIKIKLLGGSENQKIQACQLDDQQIQYNQYQNENIHFKRIEIEDQLLIEQIQKSISLFENMQTQSDKKVEKSQQNENQQFQENKNQNQNQLKELITKIGNTRQKIPEQDQTQRKGLTKVLKKVVNIESNQNENQQFNENENQNQNQNQLKELTTQTDNYKQIISQQDLPFIIGVNMVGEQARMHEIGFIESSQDQNQNQNQNSNQNENQILLISKWWRSRHIYQHRRISCFQSYKNK
ncbi:hypothetical protein ABPG73_016983, partial [Tetrahymena malaccensis]